MTSPTTTFDAETNRRNAQTGALAILGALAMLGLGYAAVPLYDLFCRVTGYGGTTAQSSVGSDIVLDETVTIRFDASRERGMPWAFKPVQREMEVQFGRTYLAFYEAHNPTDAPVAGTASFNVAPFAAGPHFVKIDCFCFEEQILMPGERVEMPVVFFVDPEIVKIPARFPAGNIAFTAPTCIKDEVRTGTDTASASSR